MRMSRSYFFLFRSTALVLAVQQRKLDAARALIEAGARIDIIPLREDGTERAPSLSRLAANMKCGDMVSLLVEALLKRDAAERWTKEWAASFHGSSLKIGKSPSVAAVVRVDGDRRIS